MSDRVELNSGHLFGFDPVNLSFELGELYRPDFRLQWTIIISRRHDVSIESNSKNAHCIYPS